MKIPQTEAEGDLRLFSVTGIGTYHMLIPHTSYPPEALAWSAAFTHKARYFTPGHCPSGP